MRRSKGIAESLEAIKDILPDGYETLTCEEFGCWLRAKLEDLEAKQTREDRDNGIVPIHDCELFIHVLKPYKESGVDIETAMELLRKKKHRGHKQQEALDTWDQFYKGKKWALEIDYSAPLRPEGDGSGA